MPLLSLSPDAPLPRPASPPPPLALLSRPAFPLGCFSFPVSLSLPLSCFAPPPSPSVPSFLPFLAASLAGFMHHRFLPICRIRLQRTSARTLLRSTLLPLPCCAAAFAMAQLSTVTHRSAQGYDSMSPWADSGATLARDSADPNLHGDVVHFAPSDCRPMLTRSACLAGANTTNRPHCPGRQCLYDTGGAV